MSSGGGKQSKYDDAWISQKHDEFQKHIDNLGTYNQHRFDENVEQNKQLELLSQANKAQDSYLKGLGEIDATQSTQIEDLFKFKTDYTDQLSGLKDRFTDLEKLYGSGSGTGASTIGDISGLDSIIKDLQSKYDSVSGYDTRMSESLNNLGETLRGEFDSKFNELEFNPNESIDLAQLKLDLETEYPELFQKTDTYDDTKIQSDLSELSGDLSRLFGKDQSLQSQLNLTSDDLAKLRNSFSGFKEQSATNLENVRTALQTEIGDVRGNLTSGLKDLRSDAFDALTDVYSSRDEALSNLSGRFGTELRQQEDALTKRIDDTGKDVEERIGRLGSMMNYRMLGDSAGGVKMRRSKAYNSGAVQTGTGQLSRTMKLKTLNI